MFGIALLLLLLPPASCNDQYNSVRSSLESHDLSKASRLLELARPTCSSETDFRRFDILVHAMSGDQSSAIKLLQDPPFFLFYAQAQLDLGRVKFLDGIVMPKSRELSPPLLFSLAGLYAQKQKYRETAALLTLIPDSQADEAVYFNLGLAYSHLHQFEDARRSYFAAIDKHPGYVAAYLAIGSDYATAGEPRLAIPWLYRARELDTLNPEGDYALAEQLIKLRYFNSARSILSADSSGPLPAVARGDLELAQGSYDTARANYQKALDSTPDFIPALMGLARCAIAETKDDEATHFAQRVLSLQPSNMHAHAELGLLELKAGHISKAALHLEQSWSSNPSPSNAIVGVALARVFRETNQPARALATLQRLHAEESPSIELHLELARVYSAIHRPSDATAERTLVKQLEAEKAGVLRFDEPEVYVQ